MNHVEHMKKAAKHEHNENEGRLEEWLHFLSTYKISCGTTEIEFTESDFVKYPKFLQKLSEHGSPTRGRKIANYFIMNYVKLGVLPGQWKDVCLRDPEFLFRDISQRIDDIAEEAKYFNKSLTEYRSFVLANYCVLNTKSFYYIRNKLETLASLWDKPITYAKEFYLSNPGAVLQKPETVIHKISLAYSLMPTTLRPANQLDLLDKYTRIASYSPEYMLANYLLWRLEESDVQDDSAKTNNHVFTNIEAKSRELFGTGFEGNRFLVCYAHLRALAKRLRSKALAGSGGTPAEKKLVEQMRDYIFKIAGKPDVVANQDTKNNIEAFLDKVLTRLSKKNDEIFDIELPGGVKLGEVVDARLEHAAIIEHYLEALKSYSSIFDLFKSGQFKKILANIGSYEFQDDELRFQLKEDLIRLSELERIIVLGSLSPDKEGV